MCPSRSPLICWQGKYPVCTAPPPSRSIICCSRISSVRVLNRQCSLDIFTVDPTKRMHHTCDQTASAPFHRNCTAQLSCTHATRVDLCTLALAQLPPRVINRFRYSSTSVLRFNFVHSLGQAGPGGGLQKSSETQKASDCSCTNDCI